MRNHPSVFEFEDEALARRMTGMKKRGFSCMDVPNARWLRELESERAKLKKLLAKARFNRHEL